MKSFVRLATAAAIAVATCVPGTLLAQQTSVTPQTARADRLYALDCGLTEFTDAAVFSDTGEYDGKPIALPTPCYLVKHGDKWLLWDTGNGDKLAAKPGGEEACGGRFTVKRTLESQLAELGLKPQDIDFVALSYLHRDHTGNIPLFPKAVFLIARSELDWARSKPTPFGVNYPTIAPLDGFKVKASNYDEDVFGDGSVRLIKAPGHTPGSRAMLVQLHNSTPILIAGDVFHTRQNYARDLVSSANTSRAESIASMQRFKEIAANTGARVVVQHEPKDFADMPKFPAFLD